MNARLWLGLIVVAAMNCCGCSMCCPSYDYCSPTNPGESNSICCGRSRRGSIFNGEYVEYSGEPIPADEGQQVDPLPAPEAPQNAPMVQPMTSKPKSALVSMRSSRRR